MSSNLDHLSRQFLVGDRIVSLRVSALRSRTGAPQFEVAWIPDRPTTLRGPKIALYESQYKRAKLSLQAELAAMQGST